MSHVITWLDSLSWSCSGSQSPICWVKARRLLSFAWQLHMWEQLHCLTPQDSGPCVTKLWSAVNSNSGEENRLHSDNIIQTQESTKIEICTEILILQHSAVWMDLRNCFFILAAFGKTSQLQKKLKLSWITRYLRGELRSIRNLFFLILSFGKIWSPNNWRLNSGLQSSLHTKTSFGLFELSATCLSFAVFLTQEEVWITSSSN